MLNISVANARRRGWQHGPSVDVGGNVQIALSSRDLPQNQGLDLHNFLHIGLLDSSDPLVYPLSDSGLGVVVPYTTPSGRTRDNHTTLYCHFAVAGTRAMDTLLHPFVKRAASWSVVMPPALGPKSSTITVLNSLRTSSHCSIAFAIVMTSAANSWFDMSCRAHKHMGRGADAREARRGGSMNWTPADRPPKAASVGSRDGAKRTDDAGNARGGRTAS